MGGGRRAKRVRVLGGRPFQLPPLCASCDGYSVHAGVVIGGRNRKGLEQLCRYIARPPLAKERVEVLPGGRVRIALKRAWSDGTTALELSRLELVERLVSLVPPPRANQVHYHGVLASRSRLRGRVRPKAPKARTRPACVGCRLTKRAREKMRGLASGALFRGVSGENGTNVPQPPRCDWSLDGVVGRSSGGMWRERFWSMRAHGALPESGGASNFPSWARSGRVEMRLMFPILIRLPGRPALSPPPTGSRPAPSPGRAALRAGPHSAG